MFRPIEKRARRTLLIGNLVVSFCAILVLPLAGSTSGYSSGAPLKSARPEVVRRDDPWKDAIVMVPRDPFLSDTAFVKPSTPSAQGADRRNPVVVRVTEASVRGLAFGQVPKAVVEVEGATKIVAPGDFINGTRITAILPDRILLNDGTVLMFSRKVP